MYRLQTGSGESIVGRLVYSEWIALMLGHKQPALAPDAMWHGLLAGTIIAHLADGLDLRRVKVMGAHRIELGGFTSGMVGRLKAVGLFSEIIAWKMTLFVPVNDAGLAILQQLVTRHALVRVSRRAAA